MTRHPIATAVLALGTLAALPACSNMYSRSSSPAPVAATQEISPGMVRNIQTTLQQQGYYKGNVDGLWGPGTQSAVASFQQAHGMRGSGELNDATLAALNAPAAAPAPTSSAAPTAPIAPVASTAPATATTPAP